MIRISSVIALSLGLFLGGCATVNESKPDAAPAPVIFDAGFQLGDHQKAVLIGEYFKIKSDRKIDVIESLNGRNWEPAIQIVDSAPDRYTVILPYGIEFPDVWVRIYGMNGEYSAPVLVHGQRQ